MDRNTSALYRKENFFNDEHNLILMKITLDSGHRVTHPTYKEYIHFVTTLL